MHLSVPKELAAELRCTMQVNLGIGHYELKVYQVVRTLARWRTRAVQVLCDNRICHEAAQIVRPCDVSGETQYRAVKIGFGIGSILHL